MGACIPAGDDPAGLSGLDLFPVFLSLLLITLPSLSSQPAQERIPKNLPYPGPVKNHSGPYVLYEVPLPGKREEGRQNITGCPCAGLFSCIFFKLFFNLADACEHLF
jgi:hypothetical protein